MKVEVELKKVRPLKVLVAVKVLLPASRATPAPFKQPVQEVTVRLVMLAVLMVVLEMVVVARVVRPVAAKLVEVKLVILPLRA